MLNASHSPTSGINITSTMFEPSEDGNAMSKVVLNIGLLMISAVSLVGNSMAMYVLSQSQLRKSRYYVLIMNQSLIDAAFGAASVFWLAAFVSTTHTQKSGVWDWTWCTFVRSQFPIAALTCASSYNLGILALERMTSIAYPTFHRNHFTRHNQKVVSAIVWIFGVGIIIPHAALTNGINSAGECYYWDRFPSPRHARIYEASFNIFFNGVPVLMMCAAYAAIYRQISKRQMASGVKLNVVRMLATCIMFYFGCHALRLGLSIASRLTEESKFMGALWALAILLMQFNSAVNPIIYTLQYQEYRRELNRLLFQWCGWRSSSIDQRPIVSESTSASIAGEATLRAEVNMKSTDPSVTIG